MKTTLFDIENWREIGATLGRNRTRTFLTAFGIFWGIFMLTTLLGGADGLEYKLRSNFEGFASNSALVFPNRRTVSYKGFNKGSVWGITPDDIKAMRQLRDIDAVAATSANTASVSSHKNFTNACVQGVDEDFLKVFLPTVNAGRFINDSDHGQRSKVCCLGTNIAAKVFPGQNPIGQFVNIGGVFYKIVGLVSQESEITLGGEKLQDSVTLPLSTFRQAFNQGNRVGAVIITAQKGHSPAELKSHIFRILRNSHTIAPTDEQAVFYMDLSEKFAMIDTMFMGVTLLAMFVGLSTLIAGIIGVGNIMWVIVKERTSEIGIRRAIGATPADIVTQILSEGVALTLIAGTAGLVVSTAILAVAEKLTAIKFLIPFSTAVEILLIFLVLGIVASVIPSLKAMKIKPIEAINDK